MGGSGEGGHVDAAGTNSCRAPAQRWSVPERATLSESGPPVLSSARVEYVGFLNVGEHREFRLRAGGPGGWVEFRFRIAFAAFGGGPPRPQDGPDICYRKLVGSLAAGETMGPGVITVSAVDLACYREAHTREPKRRSWTSSSAHTPAFGPPKPKTPAPRLAVALPAASGGEPTLETGQRVSHAVFGVGVTASSHADRTVVHFDQGGARAFVTSMLEVDVLSLPRTWETSAGGRNRPCRPR